jgi:hypothetical protein
MSPCESASVRPTTLVGIVAAICCASLSALGQGGGQGAFVPKAFYVLNVKGERFKVPGGYVFPTAYRGYSPHPPDWPDPNRRYSGLMDFDFWLADGKPSQHRMYYTSTFWPPEAGRPTSGIEDFIVSVVGAVYEPDDDLTRKQVNERRWREDRVAKGGMSVETAFGLTCYTPKVRRLPELCVTPLEADPVVMIQSLADGSRSVEMQFHSRIDKFFVELHFPQIALSRWQDVVCRTLLLIRSWRVSEGPAPPDCSKLPHLAFQAR